MSRYLDGRIDLARYQTGSLECVNQIPADSGLSVTRPGLIYDVRLNRRTVIHPYIVNSSTSYLLLFSHQAIRIAKDGQIIQSGGTDMVIASPYSVDDLYELKLDSLVDLLWIAHPNYEPRKLSRISETNWTLEPLSYIHPPMIPRAGEATNLEPDGLIGSITITPRNADNSVNTSFFNQDHVGSYWRIGHDLEADVTEANLNYSSSSVIEESPWIDVQGEWAFATSGNWMADIKIERRINGVIKTIRSYSSRSSAENISTTGTEEAGAELRISATNFDTYSIDGVVQAPEFTPSATITVNNTSLYGLVKITAVNNSTGISTADVQGELYGTDSTDLWEEGAWSEYRGFPANVQIHERRLCFSATQSFPNRIWMSKQDDREDFLLDEEAQDPISFDLPTRDVVSWMLAERTLIIGTRKEEIVLSSGRDDLALSPDNSRARTNGSIGSSRVQPVKSSNAILYAEKRGKRVRQLIDLDGSGFYQNSDITAFAPHLIDANIIQISHAQLDQKLVFFQLSNSKLLCLNHNLDQSVTSWFVIETQGEFESVATLPGDSTEDVVYVITRRIINSSEVRQLEHFAIDQWEIIEKGDSSMMVYSDMAKVIENELEVEEITGLGDWEGLELQVLADGAVQPNKTVSGGQISLSNPAKKIVVGLPMASSFTPMWFEDLNTPTQGRKRKISKAYVSMYQSGSFTMKSTDEDVFGELEESEELSPTLISRRKFTDKLGSPPSLESNYFSVSLESRHSRKQSIKFERNSPLPMIVQSLHLIYNVGEK